MGTSTSTRTKVNVASVETLNISQAGSNFVTLEGANVTKITTTGAGTIDIWGTTPIPATVTEFDGSGATGGITAVVSTNADFALKSVKGEPTSIRFLFVLRT